jgi:hypothetical protein
MISGAITFLAAAGAMSGYGTPRHGTAAQCRVSLQVVKDLASKDYSKPIVFAESDPTDLDLNPARLANGWTKFEGGKAIEVHAPPTDVTAEFMKGIRDAVSRCSSVRSWLSRHKIPHGGAAVEAVVARANEDDELPAGIFTVSLPAISADGQTALVYTSDTGGGEAGGGFALLYHRQADGTWKSEAQLRLWTS